MAITQDIGIVTAYGYAVSKGYSGTEEEFAQAMANAGITLDSITNAVDQFLNTTVPAAIQTVQNEGGTQVTNVQNAGTTQITAVNEAGANQVSAIQTKGEETRASIPSDYTQLSNEVTDLKSAFEQLPTSIQPDMSVGNVFSDDSYTSDQTPYLYRVNGGGVEVGKVEADTIVGGTVAWNQLSKAETGAYAANAGTKAYDSATRTFTVTNSTTASWLGVYSLSTNILSTANHKYLLSVKATNSLSTNLMLGTDDSYKVQSGFTADTEKEVSTVIAPLSRKSFIFYFNNASSVKLRDIQIFDLTQMFGSTIADYIYSLEQATAGAGVAFFRSLFPNDYYEYNAGELKSVEGLTSHDMVGLNQWDEEWELGIFNTTTGANYATESQIRSKNPVPILPSTQYYFNAYPRVWAIFLDADGEVVTKPSVPNGYSTNGNSVMLGLEGSTDHRLFTTPSNAHYAKFYCQGGYGNTYKNDICINISSDRNGEYKPYEKHSYPLDSSLTLSGIPKVADGKMYYDGDIYSADGKVQRKYGIVDLGSLTWEAWTGYAGVYRTQLPSNCKTMPNNNTLPNWVSPTYKVAIGTEIAGNNGTIGQLHQTYLVVHDDRYSTATDFKNAVTGKKLVYELATPTEETAQPFTEYQKVSKYGTEEYVSTSIVPVGHVTKYPTDIVSKVDGLPSDFSTLIAPTEKGFTATRAYSVNQFMIINNQLYKATASIANGATITVGTNVTATTIADILTSLLNA